MARRVIHKQVLKLVDAQVVHVSENAVFLSAQVQNGELCLWYQTEAAPTKTHDVIIFVVGTGNVMPNEAVDYIGTVQLTGQYEGLVFHVYSE